MIQQEKVRTMSRMAMLETGIGEKELNIASYKKLDYIIIQIVKGFFFGTILFLAVFFFWFCMKWDDLNLFFADANYTGFLYDVLQKYVIFVVVYMVLCGVIAARKHKACEKRRKKYLRLLSKTNRMSREISEDD